MDGQKGSQIIFDNCTIVVAVCFCTNIRTIPRIIQLSDKISFKKTDKKEFIVTVSRDNWLQMSLISIRNFTSKLEKLTVNKTKPLKHMCQLLCDPVNASV